jgi:SAM-dependent methyltransferase
MMGYADAYMSDQVTYWNGPAGERWVREQKALDTMLRPFGRAALEAAGATPGEVVLDVGCGCGESSIALAGVVGPSGRVLGVDVSAPMLARAKERAARSTNVSFLEADASSGVLPAGAFDLLFSRFGVMFFSDPARAFAVLRKALRADGRTAFVCWRSLAQNPWAAVPLDAVAAVLGRPEPQPADAPGPFSFGDPNRLRSILEGAGFCDVHVDAFDASMVFGAAQALDDAVDEIARLGAVARLLLDRSEDDIARAHAAIRACLPPHVNGEGRVELSAAAWVVTARSPFAA